MGLLCHTVVLFLVFKESPYCSPSWLYQFTFLPTVQESSLFSILSPAFIVCRHFDDGHSDWYEVVSHCSFDLNILIYAFLTNVTGNRKGKNSSKERGIANILLHY